jgi:hypothetical protein
MVSVGRRVQEAIDHMGKGELLLALTAACIALDVTAQRYAGSSGSSRADYKQFVKDHMWLITAMGFPGLMSSTVRVPFAHPQVKPDAAGNVGLEDIIYHVIRCAVMHEDEKTTKVIWNDAVALGLDAQDNLVLSKKLVWGLIGAIVFAPVNKNEAVPDDYWISVGDFKMFISEAWGRLDLAKRIVKHITGVPIP